MRSIFSRSRWLSLLILTGSGCGQLEFPVTLALVGENTITMEVPFFPPGQNVFGTVGDVVLNRSVFVDRLAKLIEIGDFQVRTVSNSSRRWL